MLYIDLTEIPKRTLLGFKINVSTLTAKKVTIEEVRNLLEITEHYVIGLDTNYSINEVPHYHIHFQSDRTFLAMQQFKKRKLIGYGTSTKIYNPKKDVKVSDPYCWYGYAVKEQFISKSLDVDEIQMNMHAHTQLEFKKSKLKYGKKMEAKKEVKKTYEEKLFEGMDKYYTGGFMDTAKHISRISLDELEAFLTISRVEYYTWKYLLTRKHITHLQYLESFQHKYNNINI